MIKCVLYLLLLAAVLLAAVLLAAAHFIVSLFMYHSSLSLFPLSNYFLCRRTELKLQILYILFVLSSLILVFNAYPILFAAVICILLLFVVSLSYLFIRLLLLLFARRCSCFQATVV